MCSKEYLKQYKRDFNALCKANHLCRNCKRQDGRTLNGHVLCWECQQRENERQNKRRSGDDYKAQRRNDAKALYQERKEQGLCPCCGRKRDSHYINCGRCRALKRRAKDKAEVARRVVENVNYPRGANGYCWRCNKEPVKEGKHLCEGCYAVQLTLLEKAWAANKERRQYAEHQQGGRGAVGWYHRVSFEKGRYGQRGQAVGGQRDHV